MVGKNAFPSPELAAAAFGVGKLTRHLFVCLGPDCTELERGEETWGYLKKRLKELNLAGPDGPFYRTKCQCLRICNGGAHFVGVPGGTGGCHRAPGKTGRGNPEKFFRGPGVRRLFLPGERPDR